MSETSLPNFVQEELKTDALVSLKRMDREFTLTLEHPWATKRLIEKRTTLIFAGRSASPGSGSVGGTVDTRRLQYNQSIVPISLLK